MTRAQAEYLAASFNDADYQAKRVHGDWVVWCHASDHVVEFDQRTLDAAMTAAHSWRGI